MKVEVKEEVKVNGSESDKRQKYLKRSIRKSRFLCSCGVRVFMCMRYDSSK